jgi:hypothetical protein
MPEHPDSFGGNNFDAHPDLDPVTRAEIEWHLAKCRVVAADARRSMLRSLGLTAVMAVLAVFSPEHGPLWWGSFAVACAAMAVYGRAMRTQLLARHGVLPPTRPHRTRHHNGGEHR